MKIFSVAYFNEKDNLITKYVASRNKANVRSKLAEYSPLLIAEYKPNNASIFWENLSDEEQKQFISEIINEI